MSHKQQDCGGCNGSGRGNRKDGTCQMCFGSGHIPIPKDNENLISLQLKKSLADSKRKLEEIERNKKDDT